MMVLSQQLNSKREDGGENQTRSARHDPSFQPSVLEEIDPPMKETNSQRNTP